MSSRSRRRGSGAHRACCRTLPICLALSAPFPSRGDQSVHPSVAFTDGSWTQLVVPGDASSLTMSELFGHSLDIERYRIDWIVYVYDAEARAYVDPGVDGSLDQGQGFWILQVTGTEVVLDMPGSVPPASGVSVPPCPPSADCAEITLTVRASAPNWHLWGVPLPQATLVEDIIVATDWTGSSCIDGCDVVAAAEDGLLGGALWHFDPETETYVNAALSTWIEPWQGLWVATFPPP